MKKPRFVQIFFTPYNVGSELSNSIGLRSVRDENLY